MGFLPSPKKRDNLDHGTYIDTQGFFGLRSVPWVGSEIAWESWHQGNGPVGDTPHFFFHLKHDSLLGCPWKLVTS